jgi:uncharacterized membrane protein YdbT with pleckstrin-like domain
MPNLLAGESLALPPVHRHWILLVRGILPLALVVVLFLLLLDGVGRALAGDLRLVGTIAAVAVLGLWAILVWLRWIEDSLTVTDQRVILEEGVLSRTSRVIPLDRVQDVATRQSLFGRLFGYGTVQIDVAGAAGSEEFAYVSAPDRLRDQVYLLTQPRRRDV